MKRDAKAGFVHDTASSRNGGGRRPARGSALSTQVAEAIQERILNRELEPRTRLPSERALEQEFGVSRTVIRETIKLLVERGLVDVQQGRGTFVTDPSVNAIATSIAIFAHRDDINLQDVLVVRRTLETEIAVLAVLHRRPEHVEEMRRAVDEMDRYIENTERYLDGVQRFHRAMAEASGNRVFVLLVDAIEELLRAARRRLSQMPGARHAAVAQHRELAEAVGTGDAARVRKLTEERLALMALHTAEAARSPDREAPPEP